MQGSPEGGAAGSLDGLHEHPPGYFEVSLVTKIHRDLLAWAPVPGRRGQFGQSQLPLSAGDVTEEPQARWSQGPVPGLGAANAVVGRREAAEAVR